MNASLEIAQKKFIYGQFIDCSDCVINTNSFPLDDLYPLY